MGTIDGQDYVNNVFRKVRVDANGRLETVDTGVNTNPERWLHDHHWDSEEVMILVNGAAGAVNLGAAVTATETRRIREVTIRSPDVANIVVHITYNAQVNVVLSLDVSAQSTKQWSSQDGREIPASQQPTVHVTGLSAGTTVYVSASGLDST